MIKICLDSYRQRLAILQSTYRTKVLTRLLERKTPEEVFTRRKPETGHFRIFKCLVNGHFRCLVRNG
jgi:hypothetical protein